MTLLLYWVPTCAGMTGEGENSVLSYSLARAPLIDMKSQISYHSHSV